MTLFYVILLINFLNQYISRIVTFIITFLLSPSADSNGKFKKLQEMTNELSTISMTDEWARYAKFKRKINKEREEYNAERSSSFESTQKITNSTTRIFQTLLGLSLTYTVLIYRSSVVATIPEQWFWPFQSLLCWSREVPGGITVPCWVIISGSFFRTIGKIR